MRACVRYARCVRCRVTPCVCAARDVMSVCVARDVMSVARDVMCVCVIRAMCVTPCVCVCAARDVMRLFRPLA